MKRMKKARRPPRSSTSGATDDRAFVDRVVGFEASTGVPHDLLMVGVLTAFAIGLGRFMRWLRGPGGRSSPHV
jgi:hypothetical protein